MARGQARKGKALNEGLPRGILELMIQTKRLDLISLSPAVIHAALDGNRATMERLLGVSVPSDWEVRHEFLELRLREDRKSVV